MNLCSYKPLMGTEAEELFNTQTANYCVGLVNWLSLVFRTAGDLRNCSTRTRQQCFRKKYIYRVFFSESVILMNMD